MTLGQAAVVAAIVLFGGLALYGIVKMIQENVNYLKNIWRLYRCPTRRQ